MIRCDPASLHFRMIFSNMICNSPFAVRGVIEGFYGVYYTWPERTDLIRFIARHQYNLYIYAPKNDRQHRVRWWQPYPTEIMAAFAETVAIADSVEVTFCYALHCTLPQLLSIAEATQTIIAKLKDFITIGVRAFCLLFDDIDLCHNGRFTSPEDVARAHASVCNEVQAQLASSYGKISLAMCPTEYYGRAPFSEYIHVLGRKLDPAIDIFYTGTEICSARITIEDAVAFGAAVRRRPLIWDNYPVNDLAMQPELHLGPIEGRDSWLHTSVRGIVVNLMQQAEASKIPLSTYSEYLLRPETYAADLAWTTAIKHIAGSQSASALTHVAAYLRSSCLGTYQPADMTALVTQLVSLWSNTDPKGSHQTRNDLHLYLDNLDEDCYHLKYRMQNLHLRTNLLPWIEILESWLWMARHALRVLDCRAHAQPEDEAHASLKQCLDEIERHPKRVTADALRQLANLACVPTHKSPAPNELPPHISLDPAIV